MLGYDLISPPQIIILCFYLFFFHFSLLECDMPVIPPIFHVLCSCGVRLPRLCTVKVNANASGCQHVTVEFIVPLISVDVLECSCAAVQCLHGDSSERLSLSD